MPTIKGRKEERKVLVRVNIIVPDKLKGVPIWYNIGHEHNIFVDVGACCHFKRFGESKKSAAEFIGFRPNIDNAIKALKKMGVEVLSHIQESL